MTLCHIQFIFGTSKLVVRPGIELSMFIGVLDQCQTATHNIVCSNDRPTPLDVSWNLEITHIEFTFADLGSEHIGLNGLSGASQLNVKPTCTTVGAT